MFLMHVSNLFSKMKKLNWKKKRRHPQKTTVFPKSRKQDLIAFQQQAEHKK